MVTLVNNTEDLIALIETILGDIEHADHLVERIGSDRDNFHIRPRLQNRHEEFAVFFRHLHDKFSLIELLAGRNSIGHCRPLLLADLRTLNAQSRMTGLQRLSEKQQDLLIIPLFFCFHGALEEDVHLGRVKVELNGFEHSRSFCLFGMCDQADRT